MGLIKGGFLRLLQTVLYAIVFCCAAIILGIYSYFLSVLADRDYPILNQWKAVEGISGAACLYLIPAVVLTCCLGGISFFAFLAIVLDIAFIGGFIAIAILTRQGAHSCGGFVTTPIGYGPNYAKQGFDNSVGQQQYTYSVTLGTACRLNKAAFAVSIIGALLLVVTAGLQVALVRRHKEEKRYGPSPSNNYTSGFGSRFKFGRKNKAAPKDAELGNGTGVHTNGHTGTAAPYGDKVDVPTNGTNGTHSAHGGYYTAPQGAANPYGYTAPAPAGTTTANY